MDQSTIAAIATPVGSGGIGIVKISGQDAFKIAREIFRRFLSRAATAKDFGHAQPVLFKGIYYGHVVDPESSRVLDEVLLLGMPGPNSHTREDVVEIHTHSGAMVIQSVLELILRKGARLAEPGEFTKRAFLNGRIDLTQAEAVIDLVNARNSSALNWAAKQLSGALRSAIESVLRALLDFQAEVEASIDFPDEANDSLSIENGLHKLKSLAADPLHRLVEQYTQTRLIKEGIRAVIVGKPNVGKSSLMNCLIKKERAIVSPLPGTTRDYIDASWNIREISVVLTDTAGIHHAEGIIENIGIQKSCERIEASDLVLYVVDMSGPLTPDDVLIYEKICQKEKILIMNKSDLCNCQNEMQIPEQWEFAGKVKISALVGSGIEALEDMIFYWASGNALESFENCGVSPNLRHKIAFGKSLESIQNILSTPIDAVMPELLAVDLKEAIRPLEETLGQGVSSDILDLIFSRFCIGK